MNKKDELLMFRMLRVIWYKLDGKEKIDFGILKDLEDKIKKDVKRSKNE